MKGGIGMFETIKRLYESGKMSEAGVRAAVEKGWLTAAQYQEITGEAL